MKRVFAAAVVACLSTAAIAATDPRTVPTKLDPAWQTKTRSLLQQVIEIPTVHNRGEVPRMANLLAEQFKAAGIPALDALKELEFAEKLILPNDEFHRRLVTSDAREEQPAYALRESPIRSLRIREKCRNYTSKERAVQNRKGLN